MFFCFVQNFFFGHHKSQNIFFLSRKVRKFFPEFNIRLYDKNSETDNFFFLHQNQNIFFSNIGNQNIFLKKKHNPPPFKLNGRSLSIFFCHIFLQFTHQKVIKSQVLQDVSVGIRLIIINMA